MNVLFLTMVELSSFEGKSIYADLMRVFIQNGHAVVLICPQSSGKETQELQFGTSKIIKMPAGELHASNPIKKGIATIRLEKRYIEALDRVKETKFDLVLYATPPITFCRAVQYVKKRDGAKTYLMLKDIFPQNAVDLGMMKTTGVRSLIWRYFRHKEKKLYAISDYIGCMSPANCRYLLRHNPEVNPATVEVCPNAAEAERLSITEEEKRIIRAKYGIPQEKKVFVYGGNLGKPQGIPFLIECLRKQSIEDAFFLIVGNGTEYSRLQNYIEQEHPKNVKLLKKLPKDDYETLICACDIGMIFLDHRFTIPNFPSRLLSYMRTCLPVLAVTDPRSDIGSVITEGGFGWWCESNDADGFASTAQRIVDLESDEIFRMKEKETAFLKKNYAPGVAYKAIVRHFEE